MCINSVLLFIETFSTEAVCFSALKGKLEETNKQYFKFSTTLFTGMSTLSLFFVIIGKQFKSIPTAFTTIFFLYNQLYYMYL